MPPAPEIRSSVGAAKPQFSTVIPRFTQIDCPSIVTLPIKSFEADGATVPQVGTVGPKTSVLVTEFVPPLSI